MGTQGWDDHDRSDKYTARDFAKNYMGSCDTNAVIFTQGDNDTYPLWYVQEVENYRPDIRIVNLSLLGVDWYADQLRYAVNDAPALKMTLEPEDIIGTFTRFFTEAYEETQDFPKGPHYDVTKVMQTLMDPNKMTKNRYGTMANYLPTRNLKIPLDRQKVIDAGMVPPEDYDKIQEIKWTLNSGGLDKAELVTLDIIANNFYDIPFYFCTTTDYNKALGLHDYFQQEGFAYRIVPYS